jgi:hypothetical protein
VGDFDITTLILSEHEQFRRTFAEIEQLTDPRSSGRRWRELADSLEVHAAGEEEVFYPELLQDVDDSEGDTEHAVKDHNEIRETTGAVDAHEVGTDAWWEAFRTCREATVDHLAEEENDVLPPFQQQVSAEHRTPWACGGSSSTSSTRTPRGSAARRSTRRRTWRSTPDRPVGSGG